MHSERDGLPDLFYLYLAKTSSALICTVRTSFRSPWQSGIAERFVGNCRRDLLDHAIVFNKRHLKRLVSEYVLYHHEDRTLLGLEKQTPSRRVPGKTSNTHCKVVADVPPFSHPLIIGVSRFWFCFEILFSSPSRLCGCGKRTLLSTSAQPAFSRNSSDVL